MNKDYSIRINIQYNDRFYELIHRVPRRVRNFGKYDQGVMQLSSDELILITLTFPADVCEVLPIEYEE